jgi:hypothetical protein
MLPLAVQNLYRDMGVAKARHETVSVSQSGRVEMEDCVLETMTGSGIFQVSSDADR